MPAEGRGLSSRGCRKERERGDWCNLATPETVQKLQTALHAKAKESPEYRFYTLYDKVYREDILAFAYAAAEPKGSSGCGRPEF